jgi:hypothetical protein
MKNFILSIVGLVLFVTALYAQNKIESTGNVGIGTTSPVALLHLYNATNPYIKVEGGGNYSYLHLTDGTSNGYLIKNTSSSTDNNANAGALYTYTQTGYDFQHIVSGEPRFTIKSSGNVGIGTTSPNTLLHLYKTINPYITVEGGGDYSYVHLTDGATNGYVIKNSSSSTANNATAGALYTYTQLGYDFQHIENGAPRFTIKTGGNVGIGTVSPSEKLSVNGNIRAKKVIVTLSDWSDYVFEKNYKLRSLSSLESFINQNKHLPEVPSAKEVEQKGISVGENQALLLKKIEELTLYIIDQQKQIDRQSKDIQILKSKK